MPGWFEKKDDKAPAARGSARPGELKGAALSRLLTADLILIAPKGLNKENLIDLLVKRLCDCLSLGDPAPFLKKVLEREQGISTTLDTGLAVPHARMDGLRSISAVLALVPQDMTDPKQPDLAIRAMFLFFSPNRQEVFTQHLHLLRAVASLFQPAFIEQMQKAPGSEAVLKLIAAKEAVV